MEKVKKRKKLKFKALMGIIFLSIIIGLIFFYLWSLPIKRVNIKGNNYLKDNYLISYLDLDKKSALSISSHKIKEKLMALDLIKNVKVRKNIFGKLTLIIEEDRILFYNLNTKKLVLESGKEIEKDDTYLGVPVLINYVKDTIYKEFKEKLKIIDGDVLKLVSEIEYSPEVINNKVIDDKRFLFRMNDGNKVYINTVNIEKFNNYLEIYEVIASKNDNAKGCLYLDSNNENNHFNNCEEEVVTPEGEGNGES